MRHHYASVRTERRAPRLAQQPRVPRYRRIVVVLLVMLTPMVGTLDFVSVSTAARSATREFHLAPTVASVPSWSQVTQWIGTSFHITSLISAPHVVGPISNR
jgi:hypothetical protein